MLYGVIACVFYSKVLPESTTYGRRTDGEFSLFTGRAENWRGWNRTEGKYSGKQVEKGGRGAGPG